MTVVNIDDHRKGWHSEVVRCAKCRYGWVAVFMPEYTPISSLHCARCGQSGKTERVENAYGR